MVTIVVARKIGANDYGVFSYYLSILTILGPFFSLGLDNIVSKRLALISDSDNYHNKLMSNVFASRCVISFLIIFSFYVYYILYGDVNSTLLLIIVLSSLPMSFLNIEQFNQIYSSSHFTLRAVLVSSILGGCLKVVVAFSNQSIHLLLLVIFFEYSVLAILLLWGYLKQSGKVDIKFIEIKYIKSLLKESFPFIAIGLISGLYMRIDQIMISHMLGNVELGIYSIAVRFSEAAYYIPVAIIASYFPKMAALKESKSEFEKYLIKILSIILRISCILILSVFIFGYYFWGDIFGAEYIDSYNVMLILVVNLIFVSLGILGTRWSLLTNNEHYILHRVIFGAIVNVILNAIMIPVYGIYGAAFSSLFAQISSSYIGFLLNVNTRVLFIIQTKSIINSIYFWKKI